MTSSEVWDEETAQRYDATSAEMFAPHVLEPAVDFLARLAGTGPALEFAVGTGRVAVPLGARGDPVTGIELSAPMLAQLRRKADEATLPVLIGDMTTTRAPGEFSLVYLVWNSISNLRSQAEQVECFRNAARHLRPGGRFVIELWVPPLRRLPPGAPAVPMSIGDGHLVFDTYDLATQQCTSHHYWRQADRQHAVRVRPLPLHLAGRMRSDGQAGRDGTRRPVRRLARQFLHCRQPEPHLCLAQAPRPPELVLRR